MRYVTREMALDAGDPALEGQPFSDDREEGEMPENEGTPERPVFARHKSRFHCMDVRPVKAAKGANKIRMVIECEYSVENAEGLAPFFDKDVQVNLRELATPARRRTYGDEQGQRTLDGQTIEDEPEEEAAEEEAE